MKREVDELNQSPVSETTKGLGSGIYVDVENLQETREETGKAQEVIKSLILSWPQTAPDPSRLNLYVRADHSALWNMWAESEFPKIAISTKGIQHFSNSQTKNSADIVMAIDAMADILLGRITYITVVSDDSDFISLYVKLREEQYQNGYTPRKVPFLWVLTDRDGTRSSTIRDYFPNDHILIVPFPTDTSPEKKKVQSSVSQKKVVSVPGSKEKDTNNPFEAMAQAIIEGVEVGRFKSTDCRDIIRGDWPKHSLATANEPTYGTEFYKKIFPILERKGVTNPRKKPRQYEMTQRAKDSIL